MGSIQGAFFHARARASTRRLLTRNPDAASWNENQLAEIKLNPELAYALLRLAQLALAGFGVGLAGKLAAAPGHLLVDGLRIQSEPPERSVTSLPVEIV